VGKVIGLVVTIICIIILLALIHYILIMRPVKTILAQVYNNIKNVKLRSILRTSYYVVLKITEPFYIIVKAVVDYLKNLI